MIIFVMDDDGDLGVAAAFPNTGVKSQCATYETGTSAVNFLHFGPFLKHFFIKRPLPKLLLQIDHF